ncbi:MAG: triosephosphate isomerase, partial [Deltaproteobacteria bacterium]|nr:triosephosphate isomerase [Deltaproteobacteria bacterium]
MYKTGAEAAKYIEQLKKLLTPDSRVDVTLAPSFTALGAAREAAQGSSISIAAQNVFWEEEGAFTGEISPAMLTSMGIKQVIIGHSERRQFFGETDETVNRRVKA